MQGVGVEIRENLEHQTDDNRRIENREHQSQTAVQPPERNGLHKIGKQFRAEIEKQDGNHDDYHKGQHIEHRRGYGDVLGKPIPDIVCKQISQICAHE